ncbi:TraY domain-containing protein [Vibrio tapetis]|uniref:Relaxosome protein TraY n=1 Tax=Vibrio tapetis subsp. tapetis TaxID=1671868 RepID=A0A2N8ZHW9_9VIBR|nr:TraY domain-containing protein [Vibrio tapetis]SON51497.1 protein of unknown function [Vibrio tapetis subsp. tapetis]
MSNSNKEKVIVQITLEGETARVFRDSTLRSNRSLRAEAQIRLEDHLHLVDSVASVGIRELKKP